MFQVLTADCHSTFIYIPKAERVLLFVPNLSKQKDSVKETGNAAVVKVVDSQAELYEMKNNKTASLEALVLEGQITQKQADSYNDYYAKHGGESRSVAN